jgi:hypothetical protein
MKRSIPLLLLACILGIALPCTAQSYATDRGAVVIGGNARISKFRDIGNDASTFLVELNPRVGYFVAPGLLLSANLQYAHYSQDLGSSSQYGIGPGVTYYFRHRKTKLNPYLSARSLYVHQSYHPDGFTSSSAHSFTWLVSAGGALFVARTVGLTGEAFYTHNRFSTNIAGTTQSNSSEEFGTLFGVSVYLF